jgi:hypothetical protein
MKPVKDMILNGTLFFIRADGCMLGYCDADTGNPNYKPMGFITSMPVAVDILEKYRCDRSHVHCELEGSNSKGKRTRLAASWTDGLDQIVMDIINQQMIVDQMASLEVFAAEIDSEEEADAQGPPLRRGRGRGQGRGGIRGAARAADLPPVRPAAVDPDDAEMPEEAREFVRTERAEQLDMNLSAKEKDRRAAWRQVPSRIRKELRRMHVNMGHPTNVSLLRKLRRAKALPEVIHAVVNMSCDACGDAVRALHPRPSRMPGTYNFNSLLWMDVFTAYDCVGTPYLFLNIVCDGTSFQVVFAMREGRGVAKSSTVLLFFTMTWTSWAGWPVKVKVDRGKEFMKDFADSLATHGVELESIPLEAP